jgi:pyruvate/2-oxoglutarate dehydrogenase complex dihydrolipoamide acyltransferase (E2) component
MATPMAQTNQSNVEGVAASTQPSTSICLTTEADATELVRLNQRIGAAWRKPDQPAPTIDDLLAKLVAAALKEYPQFETRLADSTFAIMHLGIYEIDAFTPAIGASQSAVLGVGRILAKQVVIDAQKEHVAIRQMMFLSLTCDARIVDVVSAARLLHLIKQYVEQPLIWLVN